MKKLLMILLLFLLLKVQWSFWEYIVALLLLNILWGCIFEGVTRGIYGTLSDKYMVKYGVQKSISASIHVLTGAFEKSLYSLFILSIAIPMMILSDCTLGWWAGAVLAIDFAAPAGGDRMQNFLHCFGAEVGMGLGLLMVCLVFDLWILVLLFAIFSVYANHWMKNSTTWIETAAFIVVYTGLIIKYI